VAVAVLGQLAGMEHGHFLLAQAAQAARVLQHQFQVLQ
jgi:hypothetical protein